MNKSFSLEVIEFKQLVGLRGKYYKVREILQVLEEFGFYFEVKGGIIEGFLGRKDMINFGF